MNKLAKFFTITRKFSIRNFIIRQPARFRKEFDELSKQLAFVKKN